MIRQQITQCQYDIESCKQKISELSQRIQEQTAEYNKYVNKTDEYQGKMATYLNKTNAVYEHAEKSTLSQKYQELMSGEFNESIWAGKKQQLEDLGNSMNREIENNKAELEGLQQNLNNLYSRLSSLQSQYEAALRREAAEQAAERAAAAK